MKTSMQWFFGLFVLTLALVTACGKSESNRAVSSVPSQPEVAQSLGSTAKEAPAKEKATRAQPEADAAAAEELTLNSPKNTPHSQASTTETESDDAALGTLKVRFEYGGEPFKPESIKPTSDVAFCGQHELRSERLIVDPRSRGIKNVVVYVYAGRGGSDLPETRPRSATVTLANLDCRFEPHIVVTQTGDTLKVTNPDPIGHNANFSFFNNKKVNFTIPAGQEKSVELKESEPAPVPVDCNIHPWMKGYVLVLEHPFAAVSDEGGELTIPGLPAGKKLVFRAFHEAGAIKSVVIDGEPVEWSRSRFEVDIRPGVNDLGTVVIPASGFSAN